MPVNIREIVEACELLARQDQLNLCVQESLRGAAVAGLGSFIGGLLMGPPGIAIGAAAGGLAGSATCRQYKPVWQAIAEMSEQDQNRLANHMQRVLAELDITDAILLMSVVRDPSSIARGVIAKELGNFFGQQLIVR